MVKAVNRIVTKNGVNNLGGLTRNDCESQVPLGYAPYLLRQQWMQALIDPRRDLDAECGYPHTILPQQYRYMYDRSDVAKRVVDIYADECWAMDPDIRENETYQSTEFEKKWKDLQQDEENDPLSYIYRCDIISGINRFGTLLLGVNDGADLDRPIEGISEDGSYDGVQRNFKLLFMRPFDELSSRVSLFQRDQQNPRFGKPIYYNMIFSDVALYGEAARAPVAANITTMSKTVHWSRVIHFADNREGSEVFGVPRMQPVFNRLCDVRKILGGSAEGQWRAGYPGYSFEMMPGLADAGVKLDEEKLKKMFWEYSNSMQRYIAVTGLTTKTLTSQLGDPAPYIDVQLAAIALTIGVPLRIFMGSEQAQLASGQDVRTWNRRLQRRQNRYLTPRVIRPFIDRLVMLGILPTPSAGPNKYIVRWPEIAMPTDQEKSQIADRQMAALMKYITSGGDQVMPKKVFMTTQLGWTSEFADAVLAMLPNGGNTPIVPPAVTAAEVKGQQNTFAA